MMDGKHYFLGFFASKDLAAAGIRALLPFCVVSSS